MFSLNKQWTLSKNQITSMSFSDIESICINKLEKEIREDLPLSKKLGETGELALGDCVLIKVSSKKHRFHYIENHEQHWVMMQI